MIHREVHPVDLSGMKDCGDIGMEPKTFSISWSQETEGNIGHHLKTWAGLPGSVEASVGILCGGICETKTNK